MSQQVPDGNVAARLRVVTSLAPGAIAIAEPDGPPSADGSRSYALTTFGNLDQRSDEIARGLLAWGVQPGMRLAMLVPFGAAFIVGYFDTIVEMHEVYDAHQGYSGLEVNDDGWRLVGKRVP